MKLLTKELLRVIPKLRETENDPDPMIQAKFFYPAFHWSWYVIEFDGKDLFFGFVDGDFAELGYFTLSELQETQDRFGLPIERDMFFHACRLSDLKAQLKR